VERLKRNEKNTTEKENREKTQQGTRKENALPSNMTKDPSEKREHPGSQDGGTDMKWSPVAAQVTGVYGGIKDLAGTGWRDQ